jgi:hypothetical protein
MLFVNLFSLVFFPLSSLHSLEKKKEFILRQQAFHPIFDCIKIHICLARDLRRFLSPPEYATS